MRKNRIKIMKKMAMAMPESQLSGPGIPVTNIEVARQLDEVADLLDAQKANPFRVRAYRTGAQRLRKLERPIDALLKEEGPEGLRRLPGIGTGLADAIGQLVSTGRLALLEQLRGQAAPERLLATVAGLGPELASRVHEQLGIETLEGLEVAAYDGRLAQVPGIGPKRVRGIKDALASRLRRRPFRSTIAAVPPAGAGESASVTEILDVDREYREQAEAGCLPRIAPKRFNPRGEAWLSVLHTQRADRHYTALYSNTARAHELDTIKDWVVIYRDDQDGDGQWTVVTARSGPLAGRRVVRGREAECLELYSSSGNTCMN
jgi:putative hydrolase